MARAERLRLAPVVEACVEPLSIGHMGSPTRWLPVVCSVSPIPQYDRPRVTELTGLVGACTVISR